MIDIRSEIESAPIGRYHYLILSLIGLAVFFDGYDTFNASYVVHYVMKPWGLQPSQAGFLVSSGLIGFSAAALLQGRFSDRYGRRPVLLFGLWMATVFSAATAWFADSYWTFSILRFCTGIGLGIVLPLGVTYVNEFAPARVKHTFSTWGWGLGFSLGGAAAALVGVFLTPALGWQSLYYAAALSVFLAIGCQALLPESVQFLAVRGAEPSAIGRTLGKLNPSRAAQYNEPGVGFVFPEERDRAASVALLLSARYRRTTLAAWSAAFFVLFGIYGLTGWVPTAMLARGESFAASFGYGAVILMMNFVGTLACGYVTDHRREGRGPLVVWWLLGAAAAGALAVVNIHALNLICVGAAGFFILGGQGALNNLTAVWYDTEVRGTAVGTMLGFGRLGGTLGPYVTGWLQQLAPGSSILFVAISMAALIGACMMLLASPRPAVSVTQTASA